MKLKTLGWLLLAGMSLTMVALLVSSCETEPTDPLPENDPPVVNIVNIPPDESHFTSNPEIFWYGTDIDGFIVAYEYLVVPVDTLEADNVDVEDRAALEAYAYETARAWNRINVAEEVEGSPTRQRIRLFADDDPNIAVEQVFYVRAMDDDSARSEVDLRVYSRSNNPPDTEIKFGGTNQIFWDFADTTADYRGINISWEGSDELDFGSDVTAEPTFEFYFQLFGPYDYVDTADVAGSIDTLDTSKLIMVSEDTATGSNWVQDDNATVFNLWRNAEPSDTTRVNWFVAKVTARDDAFVSDPTPAFTAFRAVNPKFENELIVNSIITPVTTPSIGSVQFQVKRVTPEGDTVTVSPADTMEQYVRDVFTEAGFGDARFFTHEDRMLLPDKILLAKYRNYVLIDDAGSTAQIKISKGHLEALSEFMDLGGNVWIWSPSPFTAYTAGATDSRLIRFTSGSEPIKYFDVTGMYYTAWVKSYTQNFLICQRDCDTCVCPPANEQFVSALAIFGKGFDNLTVDMSRSWVYFKFATPPYQYRGAPGATYFTRDLFSEPLYLFDSYYGDFVPGDLRGIIESLQGRVVGLRYDANTHRSAVFGFSFWMMPREQLVPVIERMMTWFNE
jgi:hypothetical protein